jgi:hypothetical protein
MAVPVLTPVVASFWAIPVPGMALTGIVLQAVLERVDHRRPLPAWLRVGIQPLTEIGASIWPERRMHAYEESVATVLPQPTSS